MAKKYFKAVELKYLDEETIMKIREWRNQPFVREMMHSQHEITEEEHSRYIDSLRKDDDRGLFVFYLDNIPFGVYQYQIHPEGNYITDGNYLLAQEFQDMGYGMLQAYFMAVIEFDYLHCHKVYSEVLDFNTKAIALNNRLGTLEGVLRQQQLINGEYHDVYRYGQMKSKWEEERKKIERIIFRIVNQEYEIYI